MKTHAFRHAIAYEWLTENMSQLVCTNQQELKLDGKKRNAPSAQ